MHIGAVICFVLAIFFYSFAGSALASGLVILGVFFEVLAWVIWFSEDKTT
jgi:hypothetical protein